MARTKPLPPGPSGAIEPPKRRAVPKPTDPATWSLRRRTALTILLRQPGVDPADVAQALGLARTTARALLALCERDPGRGGRTPATRELAKALRRHVGRQIAAFDAALRDENGGVDTAKVLRDLGGLKRLIDDIAADEARTRKGDADAAPSHDLAALRESLARRYDAFAGERPEQGLPGDPTGGSSPAAGAGLASARA